MKYAYAGIGMVMAGLVGVVFLVMFNSITVNNESEYYVLKEAMEASMLESVDIVCFRSKYQDGCGGTVKISEQKFVENFTRRFTASISGNAQKYDIEFYDIIESPPKATVVIKGLTDTYTIVSENGFEIANSLSGILEHNININTENDIISDDTPIEVPEIEGWESIPENKTQNSEEQEVICENSDGEYCIDPDQ